MTLDPVLVVGAGPVGLVAACHLARLGVPATVVEALDTPTTQSRAVGVHARSAEMLATLGVLDALEARGRRIGALQAVRGQDGTPLLRVGLDELPTRHPFVLDVAQPDTEAVLAARAAELGVTVRRGVALVDLHQDDEGVDVTLRASEGDEVARVGWVVGADGGHSRTRHLVGTRLDGVFHGQHFAMADVEVDTDLDRDTIWMFTHSAGLAMLFPLAGRRGRVMFAVDDPGDGDLTLERVRELAAERTGGRVTVGDDPRWLAWFEVHHGQVPQYRHGRVVLAGDAAHVHSPAGAQGMNTGIQDAANLAWKLALVARGRAAPSLLDSYHDERHPVGAAVVRTTTRLTDAGTGAIAPLRETVMRVVGHLGPVVRLAATELSELALHLRGSRLSVQEHRGRHAAARAGDHVPDPVGLRRVDGTPVAVEELLAEHPGLVALLWEPDADGSRVAALRAVLGDLGEVLPVRPSGRGDAGTVFDADDALARALGLEAGGLALVRPDGYLALVTGDTAPEALERYLTDVLGARRPSPVPAATA